MMTANYNFKIVYVWSSASSRFVLFFCFRFICFAKQTKYYYLLQWSTNCSTKTLQKLLDALRCGELGKLVRKGAETLPTNVRFADPKLQKMVCEFVFIDFIFLHIRFVTSDIKKKTITPTITTTTTTNNHRLERDVSTCTGAWDRAAKRFGALAMQELYVRNVVRNATTQKANLDNTLCIFRCKNACKICCG